MKFLSVLACFVLLCGCYKINSEDDELRTVPVTNNPTLVPESGKTVHMHNLGR